VIQRSIIREHGVDSLVTCICKRTIKVDLSRVNPGTDQTWLTGEPVLSWGDESQDTEARSGTISHTYENIGAYTISLDGENDCHETCFHSEDIFVIENPANLVATDVTSTEVTVQWDNVLGADVYYWELFVGEIFIDHDTTTEASISFIELTPETTYTICVSAVKDSIYSETYCSSNCISFATPATCNLPVCDFTVSEI